MTDKEKLVMVLHPMCIGAIGQLHAIYMEYGEAQIGGIIVSQLMRLLNAQLSCGAISVTIDPVDPESINMINKYTTLLQPIMNELIKSFMTNMSKYAPIMDSGMMIDNSAVLEISEKAADQVLTIFN